MLLLMSFLASSRPQFVVTFLLVIAVIDLGHSERSYASPGPSGFTRIARDLERRFCSPVYEGSNRPWTCGPDP
jgi:hypothetical protein